MDFTRNYLDTFTTDHTSLQMSDEQKAALQDGLLKSGGEPQVVAAFVLPDVDDNVQAIIPLGDEEIDDDEVWHNPLVVQVTYVLDPLEQNDLRSVLIQAHNDLIVNGPEREIAARKANLERLEEQLRQEQEWLAARVQQDDAL